MNKLKFLTTLTLISVIFAACEMNEDVISENHYSNDLKIKLYEKKYEQLMTEKKFVKSFSKIPKKSSNSILNRTVMEDEYGFTISDKPAKVIEMNGDVSYTFLIERDSIATDFFENLVVQTDSLDNTEAYIIKYTLTSDFFNTDHNSLDYTATKEITSIIYNNQNSTSSTSNKIIYQTDCVVVNYITCCQSWSGGPGSCHPAQEVCLTSSAGTQYLSSTSETICTTTEIDLGDTSGGGSSSSGSGGSGGGGSVNTSPVNNCTTCIEIDEEIITPQDLCNDLAAKDANPDFINYMADLKSRAASQNFESAYTMFQNAILGLQFSPRYDGSLQEPEVNIGVGFTDTLADLNSIGAIHCHLDNGTTFKIFSFSDIIALAEFADISTRPTSEFGIYVVTSSGTFCLKIKNKIQLKQMLTIMRMTLKTYEDDFDKFVKKEQNLDTQVLEFLKFLKIKQFGNILELYKKDETNNVWQKQELNSNETTVTPTNC